MSNPIVDFLLKSLGGAAEGVEETFLVSELQQLHDQDLDEYKGAIYGGKFLAKALSNLKILKTGFGAAMVDGITQAINQSATANGIDLSVPITIAPTANVTVKP